MRLIAILIFLFISSSCNRVHPPSVRLSTVRLYSSDQEFETVTGYFTVDNGNNHYPIVYRAFNPFDPEDCEDTTLPIINAFSNHQYIIQIYKQGSGEQTFNLYKQFGFQLEATSCYAYDMR